jgi:hypothetical protein
MIMMRRRRMLIAAMAAVSIILSVRFASSFYNNYHHHDSAASSSSSLPPMEEEHRRQITSKSDEEETILMWITTSENNHPLHHQQRQRQLEECYEVPNNWHLAMKGKNACTNSLNFPPAWTNPSMSSFFKPTCLGCCQQMFPKLDPAACVCEDVCNQGGGGGGVVDDEEDEEETCSGPCCDRYWHPDLTAQQSPYTCTNTYKDDNPLMVGTTMFKTVEDCCQKLTNGNVDKKCVIVEADECKTNTEEDSGTVVTSTPTPRPTLLITIPPHLLRPPTTPRPTLLITIPPHLLLPPVTPRPTWSITIPPHLLLPPTTRPPTKLPTIPPTPLPTRSPTPLPTQQDNMVQNSSPVSTPTTNTCTDGFKWHRGKPSQGSTCTNDQDYPRAWDDPQVTTNYLFDTPEECCLKHFTLETCAAMNACGVQQTLNLSFSTPPPTPAPTPPSGGGGSSSSSSNCAGKWRRSCSLDTNCSWNRLERSCVDATTNTMQQTSSSITGNVQAATTSPTSSAPSPKPSSAPSPKPSSAPSPKPSSAPTPQPSSQSSSCSSYTWRRRACSRDPSCTWSTLVNQCVSISTLQ